ncbi:MAG: phage integrase N-terminal SAM-like domain-containing protein [Bacteroidales bacterium]|jgi:integrase/recombinase XerD|nr:phage integrase N-terminal SAM-like domain-containing protein [Bacteroidales bacterium]
MSKQSYLLQAGESVPEYKIRTEQFMRKYTIAGKSSSCIHNYLMQISKLVLHYQCSPLELSIDQLEEYLFYLCQKSDSPSQSSFKHLVYGLRSFYEIFKNEDLRIFLPACNTNLILILSS